MDSLLQDVRFGLRILLRTPLVTGATLFTLMLGIGANTAMFSLVDAVLLHPLRFPDAQNLALIWERGPTGALNNVSAADFLDWRSRTKTFTELAGWSSGTYVITGSERPEQATGAAVTANLFRTLGARPVLGRTFLPGEDGIPNPSDASNVVIISYRLWQENLGGDPNVLGRTLFLNQVPYAIIGVMGPEFQFMVRRHSVWIPVKLNPTSRDFHLLTVVGRLRVPRDQAIAEMVTIEQSLAEAYPKSNKGWTVEVDDFRDWLQKNFKARLLLLAGALALILLIACTNVASLLLARSASRSRELALRVALGATPSRLVRQLLVESLFLGLTGGLLGLVLSYFLLAAAPSFLPGNAIPAGAPLVLSPLVLLFTLGISLATGLLFGLAPALAAGRTQLQAALKDATRGSSGGRNRQLFRQSMVVVEVAAGLVLLSSAALLAKGIRNLEMLDVGAQPKNVLIARLFLPQARYSPAAALEFHRRALERIESLPGVESASVATNLPLFRLTMEVPFDLETAPPRPLAERPGSGYTSVTPGYWRTLGIKLEKGRVFTDSDTAQAAPVVMVNEAFADRYFPNQDPVGQTILLNRPILGKDDFEETIHPQIIGVVGNVNVGVLAGQPVPVLYAPDAQNIWSTAAWLAVRTTLDPAALTAAVRQEMRDLDKDIPIEEAGRLEKVYQDQFAEPRFQSQLMAAFAALALVLAVVGIYGINAYSVAQRGREIAVRTAMGARPGQIFGTILAQGLKLAAVGVGLGLILSFVAARLLRNVLVGVGGQDPLVLVELAILLMLVAAVACFIPARRALGIDPASALRQD